MACLSECTTHFNEDLQHVNQTELPNDRIHPVPPLDTLLLPPRHCRYIKPIQEGILPLVLKMERGVEVRVEMLREIHFRDADEDQTSIRLGWLEGIC